MAESKLHDRAALITGAGTGIGRAISLLFAREGARVAVNYNQSRDAAEEVVSQIRAAGGKGISVAADVTKDAEVRAMVDRVAREFGRLDILINNAGWSTRVLHRNLDDLTDEIWNKTLDINLKSVFYCVRAAVPVLIRQPGASIVNIASASGFTGIGSSIVYSAAKAGVLNMTKSLARALAPEIRVNAVAPGLIRTHFAGRADSDPLFDAEDKATPLQRLATAEDCAAAALFLAVDAKSVTGETILVDGGRFTLGAIR
ncbi:MAG: SDR family oxidoreductase [Candidatus Acidiferrales bacterium]